MKSRREDDWAMRWLTLRASEEGQVNLSAFSPPHVPPTPRPKAITKGTVWPFKPINHRPLPNTRLVPRLKIAIHTPPAPPPPAFINPDEDPSWLLPSEHQIRQPHPDIAPHSSHSVSLSSARLSKTAHALSGISSIQKSRQLSLKSCGHHHHHPLVPEPPPPSPPKSTPRRRAQQSHRPIVAGVSFSRPSTAPRIVIRPKAHRQQQAPQPDPTLIADAFASIEPSVHRNAPVPLVVERAKMQPHTASGQLEIMMEAVRLRQKNRELKVVDETDPLLPALHRPVPQITPALVIAHMKRDPGSQYPHEHSEGFKAFTFRSAADPKVASTRRLRRSHSAKSIIMKAPFVLPPKEAKPPVPAPVRQRRHSISVSSQQRADSMQRRRLTVALGSVQEESKGPRRTASSGNLGQRRSLKRQTTAPGLFV